MRTVGGIARLLRFKIVCPELGVIATTADGIMLNFKYPAQFMPTLAVFKELVEPEYEYLRRFLTKDSVFFDVGGGIGTYTVFAAKIVDGPVHTFEPVIENIETIRLNIRANAVESKIQLNYVALSETEGFTEVVKGDSLFVSNIKGVSRAQARDSVRVTTIDSYCSRNKIDRIDAIKIDAEGHERKIIEGSRRMLENNKIGVIIVEADHRCAPFYSSLRSSGFEVFYYDYRVNALKRVSPVSEEAIRKSEPSGFSSNIVLVHKNMLARHYERFAMKD